MVLFSVCLEFGKLHWNIRMTIVHSAIYRGYPAKRALSAMRKHGGLGPFGRIPSICMRTCVPEAGTKAGTSNTSHRYQVHSTVNAVCDYFPGPRYQLLAHNPHVWVDICLSKYGLIGTCIYIWAHRVYRSDFKYSIRCNHSKYSSRSCEINFS